MKHPKKQPIVLNGYDKQGGNGLPMPPTNEVHRPRNPQPALCYDGLSLAASADSAGFSDYEIFNWSWGVPLGATRFIK